LVLEFNLFQVAAPKKKPKEKAEKVEATSAKGGQFNAWKHS
jgi:hypothetical protein